MSTTPDGKFPPPPADISKWWWEIYHTLDQNVKFDDVYTACIQFLQANPSECILMGIGVGCGGAQQEFGPSDEEMFDRYQQMHPDFWYLGDAIPTLDEVRGKIVLLRGQLPKGIDGTGFIVQGNYVVDTPSDMESHITTVTNFLAQAATANDDDWYWNWTNGAPSDLSYTLQYGTTPSLVAMATNPRIAAKLSNYAPDPFVRFGTVVMDFPETPAGLLRQLIDLNGYSCLSIGGYDLKSTADRVFAFDYDGSGKLDHLVLYRPGAGVIYILKKTGGQFSAVYASGNGIGGYDLKITSDQAFAFDYDHSGKLDHLVFYRPSSGVIYILKNTGGNFSTVPPSGGNGIGGYDLKSTADRVFAFDYDGSGKPDNLVLYRPGAGIIYMLKNSKGQFS